MFLVVAEKHELRWVSGIFRERSAADAYLAEVPEDYRPFQSIVETSPTEYPVYLIEEARSFSLHSREAIRELIAGVQRVPDDEWCYFNVYVFVGDWRPFLAGTDYMGIIPHVHFGNLHLDRARVEGIESVLPLAEPASAPSVRR